MPELHLHRREALILLLASVPPAAAALLAAGSPDTLAMLRNGPPGSVPAPPVHAPPDDELAAGPLTLDGAGVPSAGQGSGPAGTLTTTMAGWGSSTMAGMAAELQALAAGHRLTYVNGGAGGQTAEQILARLGSRPARMDAGRVPARGAVLLTTGSISARSPAAFDAWGTLAGIPGHLAKDRGRQPGYTFLRTLAGAAREVPDGTPFLPGTGMPVRTGINHLNIGKNNLTSGHRGLNDPARIASLTGDAYDWLAATGGRVLVWGHFANTGTARTSPVRERITEVNARLQARYGSRYLDLYGLVTGDDVWELAGVRPTAEDRRQQKAGNKPPSLSRDRAHLNGPGRRAVRLAVERRLTDLGWFTTAAPAPRTPAPSHPPLPQRPA